MERPFSGPANREVFSITVGNSDQDSIYSLAASTGRATPGSTILAAGGPDGTVRLWDSRIAANTTKPISTFLGHTGNVRSILISEDGEWVLSASADSSIRLWSVTAGRFLHTFDMHSDSVWSLHSQHPSLQVFYSSDRIGTIVKTDLRGIGSDVDKEGVCTVIANEHSGVSKVVSAGPYIWAATCNSRIHRWLDFDTTDYAFNKVLYESPEGSKTDLDKTAEAKDEEKKDEDSSSAGETLKTHFIDLDGSPTLRFNKNLPEVLLSLGESAQANPPAGAPGSTHLAPMITNSSNNMDPLATTVTNSSAISPTDISPDTATIGTAESASVVYSILPGDDDEGEENELADVLESTVVEPVYINPVETLQGKIGLIKHQLLPNRRHVLTLDTDGVIKLWDLVQAVELTSYPKGLELEDVADNLRTFDVVSNWCQVTTRSGELFITLDENSCFDAEMYAEEILPTIGQEVLSKSSPLNPSIDELLPDQRINLGKWVLTNLLANVLSAEKIKDLELRKDLAKRRKEDGPNGIKRSLKALSNGNGKLFFIFHNFFNFSNFLTFLLIIIFF